MARMPWMKLWTEDLDRDCSGLSLLAFGAWMRIILDLRKHGGARSLTLDQWARVVRASKEDTRLALSELFEQGICDSDRPQVRGERGRYRAHHNAPQGVTRNASSRSHSAENNAVSNAIVTVICRRIVREHKADESNRLRQERLRERRQRNAKVTPRITPKSRPHNATEADADAEAEAESSSGSGSSSGNKDIDSSSHSWAKPVTEKRDGQPDAAFEAFAEAFKSHRKIPYRKKKADFVQLAELRRGLGTAPRALPADWNKAVGNYFASVLSSYTLAHLCVKYDMFLSSPLDKYGKPDVPEEDYFSKLKRQAGEKK